MGGWGGCSKRFCSGLRDHFYRREERGLTPVKNQKPNGTHNQLTRPDGNVNELCPPVRAEKM